ncbi:MAG: hypothetical protein ACFCVK_25710 [Acidimicrobiales bacterium]
MTPSRPAPPSTIVASEGLPRGGAGRAAGEGVPFGFHRNWSTTARVPPA